ncbi:MAG: TonB-dependent receptor, partial [Bacteroidales bacterium]|nr:TonB-dependent receptor [Bacteroidales bacterium]
MRLSFVFLAVGMLQLSAKAVSQRLSFEFIQVELKEAIRQIEHQTEYLFLYNAGEIDDRSKIDLHMKNKTLTEVLDKMLENTSVEYFIRDRHIILKAKGQHPAQSVSVAQPANVVAGVITDENGEPMAGAAIQIQGSTRGVTTDRNGSFSISVKPEDVLEVSFVGYETQTVTVGERKVIAVQLQPKADELEEVTIVAFGKQKKESVIGSITTVSPADLKVPSSNLTTAFAGQMAGVIAYQRSGEPGADDADFFVRGITTFGGRREPLILIDNVELSKTDLARLQPDDIASFSIMKDATATALYGARGANGVILVTTKQGTEGPARISVRVENSLSAPTRKVELADPVTWMQLANEAVLTRNPMGADVYSQEKIDNTISGRDPLRYPANDWMDMLIRDVTTSQRYNMSISGGGAVARYYVAAALNHDNGIIKVDDRQNFNNNISNNSYSVRSNIELRLTKTTNLNVRVSGSFDDYSGPLAGGSDLFNSIVKSNAVEFPAYFPKTEETQDINHIFFGNKEGRYINPYAESLKGYKERNRSQLLAQLELNQKLDFITEGLSARGMMNISRLSQFAVSRFYTPFWYEISRYDYNTKKYALTNTNPTSGTDWLDYREDERAVNATFYAEAMANYNRTFGDHSVSGLLVGIVRSSLDAPAGTLQMSLPYHNLGLSGRFTYAFASRYFTEFNFGYNGSERFAKSQRWGFFPSAGAAWNIANEAFWGNLKETVNVLKLRYSYGLVGNDEIGSAYDRFYYLSEVDMNNGDRSYTFGRELTNDKNGIYISRDANPDITWEISRKQNYAMEIELWQSSLKLIAEYFREKRVNILMARSYIPSTMGLSYTLRSNAG